MKLRLRAQEDTKTERPRKSRTRKALQGIAVFLVMFAVLWTVLSRYGRNDD